MSHDLKDGQDLLDSKLTDAQFRAGVAANKFLFDCKTKGFPRLSKLGRFGGGFDHGTALPEPKSADYRKQIAVIGSVLVNDGMHISKAAAQCNVSVVSLKHYCKKFGIELTPIAKRRERATEDMCRQAIDMVNEQGLRISHAAEKLGTSSNSISNSLARMGYKYDARTVRIVEVA